MENAMFRSEVNGGCPFCHQQSENLTELLEHLQEGSKQVLDLFSSAMRGDRQDAFYGQVAQVRGMVKRLTSYTRGASKECVKEVADRVGGVLFVVCDRIKKEPAENAKVATSLIEFGDSLVDLHEVAVRRYSDGVIG